MGKSLSEGHLCLDCKIGIGKRPSRHHLGTSCNDAASLTNIDANFLNGIVASNRKKAAPQTFARRHDLRTRDSDRTALT